MPQKKNPHALERVKATAGQAIGWPAAILGTQRSAMSTDLDLIFSRDIVAGMYDDVKGSSELMCVCLETLQVHAENMRKLAVQQWSTTSHLADELVRRTDMSFRLAHQIVGAFVKQSIEGGYTASSAPLSLLDDVCRKFHGSRVNLTKEQFREILDAEGFVRSRASAGGVQPDSVREQIEDLQHRLTGHRNWYLAAATEAREAIEALLRRVAAFVGETKEA